VHGLRRAARLLSVAFIASSGIFAVGLLLASITDTTGAVLLPMAVAFALVGLLLTLAQPEVRRVVGPFLRRHAEAISLGTLAVGTFVALIHYGLAAVALQHGPDARGHEFLLTANTVAPVTAALAAGAQVVLALRGAPRIRERVLALVLLAVATTVPVAAMLLLGRTLAALQPLAQPETVNSLVLATWGVGRQLVVVPLAFGVAALLVPAAAWTRGRVLARREPVVSR
jgi:hypothetical protein